MSPSLPDIRNCPRCGKVFARVSRNLCPQCVREEDEMTEKVKQYLREHKGASLSEVVEATGAEESLVLRLIREGRIIVSDGEPALNCQRCGRPISEGRFCSACANELARGLLGTPKPASTPAPEYSRNARVHLESRTKRDNPNN